MKKFIIPLVLMLVSVSCFAQDEKDKKEGLKRIDQNQSSRLSHIINESVNASLDGLDALSVLEDFDFDFESNFDFDDHFDHAFDHDIDIHIPDLDIHIPHIDIDIPDFDMDFDDMDFEIDLQDLKKELKDVKKGLQRIKD